MLGIMMKLARLMALLGGIVLSALVLMTCASIVGRALIGLGLGPVPGDFELLEAGIGFCVFAFLPWCQMTSGHATVDLLEPAFPGGMNRALLAFWDVVMAGVMVLLALRLYEGMLSKISNGETTFLLQFPIWWAYAACLLPAVVAVVVALWCAWARIYEAVTGKVILPRGQGASH